VHYPAIEYITDPDEILKSLSKYHKSQIISKDHLESARFVIDVRTAKSTDQTFGLSAQKWESVKRMLSEASSRSEFCDIFKMACFLRPFYIGKANDLRIRLCDHFERRNSSLLSDLDGLQVPREAIWIGTKAVDESLELRDVPVLEEIMQRICNPPLVKRFG